MLCVCENQSWQIQMHLLLRERVLLGDGAFLDQHTKLIGQRADVLLRQLVLDADDADLHG